MDSRILEAGRQPSLSFVISVGMHMKQLHLAAFTLVMIGGLNWLLFGLFGWDIGSIFGGMGSMVSRAIYVLVGLAAISEIVTHKQNCRRCNPGGSVAM